MEKRKLKILFCPLDWGLGHATRSVPVIRKFLESGYEVVIAADGRPYAFLEKEFPDCRIIRFPGTHIYYQDHSVLWFRIMIQVPKLLAGIFRENRLLKKITRKEKPDIIFSDNRYGASGKGITSIIMTHQLQVMLPHAVRFMAPLVNSYLHRKIKKFDECWVPDFQQHHGLAGKLSHPEKMPFPVTYIGTLSRFSSGSPFQDFEPELFNLLVILSGPEPQRTILEEKIFTQLRDSSLKAIIVRGQTEKNEAFNLSPNIRVYSHLDTISLRQCLLQSELVICRSGYSGIMDLVTMGKKAILVPTPGQTEQEYLARYLMEKKVFFSIPQDKFDLLYAIEMTRNFPGMVLENDYKVLTEKIRQLSGSLSVNLTPSPSAVL